MKRKFPPMAPRPKRELPNSVTPNGDKPEETYLLSVKVTGRGGNSKWTFRIPRAKMLEPDYPAPVFADLVRSHEHLMGADDPADEEPKARE